MAKNELMAFVTALPADLRGHARMLFEAHQAGEMDERVADIRAERQRCLGLINVIGGGQKHLAPERWRIVNAMIADGTTPEQAAIRLLSPGMQ